MEKELYNLLAEFRRSLESPNGAVSGFNLEGFLEWLWKKVR